MNVRLVLLLAPLLLLAGLVQAYFWVPKYDQQTRATPARLETFIEGESADAKILNPALNADSQSSRIVSLIFDGLLDLDENLNLRGRLATDWESSEQVFIIADENLQFPDGTTATPERLRARIERAKASGDYPELSALVQRVEVIEGGAVVSLEGGAAAGETAKPAAARVRLPPQVLVSLTRIEPDILELLAPVLGRDYGRGFDPSRYLLSGGDDGDDIRRALEARLPLVEHNPVIEFRLRRNVRFHDGHPFTAEDVKFTYEAIMARKNLSPRTSDFEPIKSVEALNPHRVRVTYKRLFSPAVNAWTMGILPAHLLGPDQIAREAEERGLSAEARDAFGLRDSRFNRAPVGTGPFRFVEWQGDELIKLSRNEDYWDGPPEYRDYYFRVVPDPLTKELEFRAGAIDTYQLQPFQVARFETSPRYRTLSGLGSGYTYIGYNNRLPLFSDPKVRRALGMAIDVDEIIRYVMYGEGERTTGPYPKQTDWYDRKVSPLPYDPEGALRILESLGWRKNPQGWLEKDGKIFEFNLITNHGNLIRKAILSVAQNSWKRIGVKVNTQVFEWAVFLEDFINPGRFDAVILGWLMGADPDLYQLWHSSQSGRNQLNFVGYNNPAADRIIETLRREYDRDAQVKLARELHRIIAENQPYTFLYAPIATRALDRKIVMVTESGDVSAPRASAGGDVFFHFNRWRKLEAAPDF